MYDLIKELFTEVCKTSPILGVVGLLIGGSTFVWSLKLKYKDKRDVLEQNMFKDLADLYSKSLKEQEMLSEEIRKTRRDLRCLAAKSKEREILLKELHYKLELWSQRAPTKQEIIDELNKFKEDL